MVAGIRLLGTLTLHLTVLQYLQLHLIVVNPKLGLLILAYILVRKTFLTFTLITRALAPFLMLMLRMALQRQLSNYSNTRTSLKQLL